ncbi:CvfB family protein [Vagococcus xieshaowenii]|uniref:DNA-binding protein n=1 Tax=Vagococcus xieshaowenii TaxID=2562451 RepID=A0AAJ5EDR7_9ENTE|nr:S1-like domain-containing RNA-binding protein [Vagococcus xieshaowenii]QCA28720.1 DNA-binding protein [Vagococcus xieshaowenii]TFZ40472.1 DNA-binding protein [Vagococcus xieshaowenii]
MKDLLGTVWTGLIIDENDISYFVQKNGYTFKLAKSEGEHALGEAVEGFAYLNQKSEGALTTQIPEIVKGKYGFVDVVGTRRDLGAFVDIGLKDKDIALSSDELPAMKELWPKKDDRLYVTLRTDDKDRLWAELADEELVAAMSRPATEEMHNKDVIGTVYRVKVVGTFVLTEDYHLAFIHPSERFNEPRLGEKVTGRVIGIRPDGMLNISLKPRAHEVISDDANMILTFLRQSRDGKIPYTDKSTPEEIKEMFAISKAQFKRALGSLLKARKIKQENGFTILLEEATETTSDK